MAREELQRLSAPHTPTTSTHDHPDEKPREVLEEPKQHVAVEQEEEDITTYMPKGAGSSFVPGQWRPRVSRSSASRAQRQDSDAASSSPTKAP